MSRVALCYTECPLKAALLYVIPHAPCIHFIFRCSDKDTKMWETAELETSGQYRGKRIAIRSSYVIRSSQISSPIKFTKKQLTERRNCLLCKGLKDGLVNGPKYHISTAEIPSYKTGSKDDLQTFESRES